MSILLNKISRIKPKAADVLRKAGLVTDSDIQALDREDLRDLFPETQQFKLRKQIFEIIHERKPISLLLKDMESFIPYESLRAAISENGVLVHYLEILKDMKTQVNSLQAFFDAHIDLLENIGKNQAALEPSKGCHASHAHVQHHLSGSSPSTSTSSTYGTVDPYKVQNTLYQQRISCMQQSPKQTVHLPQRPQVKCRLVVAGTTFDAHLQLLEKVKRIQDLHLDLVFLNGEEDYQVNIVFCPISSRIGTDVEAAMSKVTGNKPVILVLMEHTREAKLTNMKRIWGDYSNVELQVYVYYHDTMHGLLKCEQNNGAAVEIQRKLLEYSNKMNQDTGNTQEMAADLAGVSVRGGGNDSGSNVEKSSFMWGGFFSRN